MKRNTELMIGIGLILVLLTRRRDLPGARSASSSIGPGPTVGPEQWREGWGTSGEPEEWWHWPVPDLVIDGVTYPAQISQEYHLTGAPHRGVDIMYKRIRAGDRPEYTETPEKDGTRAASGPYFAPPNTPVCAARDATVWSVARTNRGIEVVLDHGKPWATYYAHLERIDGSAIKMGTARGKAPDGSVTKVRAGQILGLMGGDPSTGPRLRHLHFEAWYKGSGPSAAVDLGRPGASPMDGWRRTTWSP